MTKFTFLIRFTYRKLVDEVPADFLGEESIHTEVTHYLRQLTGISECVRQPKLKYTQSDQLLQCDGSNDMQTDTRK